MKTWWAHTPSAGCPEASPDPNDKPSWTAIELAVNVLETRVWPWSVWISERTQEFSQTTSLQPDYDSDLAIVESATNPKRPACQCSA